MTKAENNCDQVQSLLLAAARSNDGPLARRGSVAAMEEMSGYWHDATPREVKIKLICFGSYHELSINGTVTLSLADTAFTDGFVGFYVETAELQISELSIQRLQPPTQSDEHLATG